MDSQPVKNRRGLFRRLVALAGLGITGVLLSQEKTGLLRRVEATSGGTSGTALIIDGSPANMGTGTTELDSSTGGPAPGAVFFGRATASSGITTGVFGQSDSTSGTGVEGFAPAPTGATFGVFGESFSASGVGVEGFASGTSGVGVRGVAGAGSGSTVGVNGQSNSTRGIGVEGLANASGGISVQGQAGNDGAIPIVAKANSTTQAAPLQEWQNSSSKALSVVDASGRFGVGTRCLAGWFTS